MILLILEFNPNHLTHILCSFCFKIIITFVHFSRPTKCFNYNEHQVILNDIGFFTFIELFLYSFPCLQESAY